MTLPEGAEPIATDVAVLLELTIDHEGTVVDARIVEGAREDIDAAVLEAARRIRFSPATRDGQPIGARIRFRYRVAASAPPPIDEPVSDAEADDPTEPTGDPGSEDDGSEDDGSEDDADTPPPLGVTATVDPNEPGAGNRITLRGAELSTVPGTFGEPLRVVATLPGVARSPFGLGFFLVRGADFQNTGFMVDGFVVPLLYHVGAGPAILPTRLVSNMSFYSGNYPVRFGRFSGGLISLETAIPEVRSAEGEVSIDATRAAGLVIVPTDDGRGAVAAGFRRSYFELFLPLIQPGLELSFTDYQLMGQYRVDPRLDISFFFFGANDNLDQTGQIGDGSLLSDGSRSRVFYDLQRLIATARINLGGGDRLTISGMAGRDGSGFSTVQPGLGMLSFDLEAFFFGWRIEAELEMTEELRARTGIDVNALSANVLGTAPVPPGLGELPRPLPTISANDATTGVVEAFVAAFYEQIIDLAPLELSIGLRLDALRYGDVFEIVPDPRFVARVTPHPMITLKAAGGLFVQQPSPFTIFRVGGNPSVAPERAWQSSAGVELRFPEQVEGWVTGFYNRMWNIARPVNSIVPDEITGLHREFFVSDQEGQAYGLEAMLRLRRDGFYGWITYTLSRSERWDPTHPEPVAFNFDQTHVLNLVLSYAFDGWRVGGSFQLATGHPTPTLGGTRFDADTGAFGAIPGPGHDRLPYAHRLDLRIDRDFEIGPVRGAVYLDILNVYFSELPEGRLFQYDYAQSGYLRGLPIIPSLGIRGTIH